MMTAPAPDILRLEYGRQYTFPNARRRRWRVMSLVAMLPGVVVPFVPFACDRSPSDQVLEAASHLASADSNLVDTLLDGFVWLPFFLSIPIVWWMILRLWGRSSSRAGRTVVFAVGGCIGLGFVAVLAKAVPDIDYVAEAAVFGGVVMLLAVSAASVTILLLRQGLVDDCVMAVLVGPYVVTLILFLVAYQNEAQLGWYLSLTPSLAALGELLLIGAAALRPGSRGSPRADENPIPNAD